MTISPAALKAMTKATYRLADKGGFLGSKSARRAFDYTQDLPPIDTVFQGLMKRTDPGFDMSMKGKALLHEVMGRHSYFATRGIKGYDQWKKVDGKWVRIPGKKFAADQGIPKERMQRDVLDVERGPEYEMPVVRRDPQNMPVHEVKRDSQWIRGGSAEDLLDIQKLEDDMTSAWRAMGTVGNASQANLKSSFITEFARLMNMNRSKDLGEFMHGSDKVRDVVEEAAARVMRRLDDEFRLDKSTVQELSSNDGMRTVFGKKGYPLGPNNTAGEATLRLVSRMSYSHHNAMKALKGDNWVRLVKKQRPVARWDIVNREGLEGEALKKRLNETTREAGRTAKDAVTLLGEQARRTAELAENRASFRTLMLSEGGDPVARELFDRSIADLSKSHAESVMSVAGVNSAIGKWTGLGHRNPKIFIGGLPKDFYRDIADSVGLWKGGDTIASTKKFLQNPNRKKLLEVRDEWWMRDKKLWAVRDEFRSKQYALPFSPSSKPPRSVASSKPTSKTLETLVEASELGMVDESVGAMAGHIARLDVDRKKALRQVSRDLRKQADDREFVEFMQEKLTPERARVLADDLEDMANGKAPVDFMMGQADEQRAGILYDLYQNMVVPDHLDPGTTRAKRAIRKGMGVDGARTQNKVADFLRLNRQDTVSGVDWNLPVKGVPEGAQQLELPFRKPKVANLQGLRKTEKPLSNPLVMFPQYPRANPGLNALRRYPGAVVRTVSPPFTP